jgi:hypothetical protein
MASVNMRLIPGAVRYAEYVDWWHLLTHIFVSELHWHKTAEWAYILKGNVQVTAVNADGQNFIDTVVSINDCPRYQICNWLYRGKAICGISHPAFLTLFKPQATILMVPSLSSSLTMAPSLKTLPSW